MTPRNNASKRAEKALENMNAWKDKREYDMEDKPFAPVFDSKKEAREIKRRARR